MQLTCSGCGAKLSIPDQRVPNGRRIVVSCPRCKSKAVLDGERPSPMTQEAEPKEEASAAPPGAMHDFLDFHGEEKGLALVMSHEPQQAGRLRQPVEQLGYRFMTSQSQDKALGLMEFRSFDLILLCDGFDGVPLGKSAVLNYLNHLPMSARRKMFLGLISDAFQTMDPTMAFALSADLVINRVDLEKLAGILRQTIKENEEFYRVFKKTLTEVGKV